jgi:hypothetical protein
MRRKRVRPKILKNIEGVKVGYRWGEKSFLCVEVEGLWGERKADEDIGNVNPSRFGTLVRI